LRELLPTFWSHGDVSLVPDRSVAMTEHAAVIAGGGPTGLMLAAELALAGVDVAIVERRASQELIGSRAGGLHVQCTWDRVDDQVAAQAAHPTAVRAGGWVFTSDLNAQAGYQLSSCGRLNEMKRLPPGTTSR
jgi:choline dehydrogenase-like flavoprotein